MKGFDFFFSFPSVPARAAEFLASLTNDRQTVLTGFRNEPKKFLGKKHLSSRTEFCLFGQAKKSPQIVLGSCYFLTGLTSGLIHFYARIHSIFLNLKARKHICLGVIKTQRVRQTTTAYCRGLPFFCFFSPFFSFFLGAQNRPHSISCIHSPIQRVLLPS